MRRPVSRNSAATRHLTTPSASHTAQHLPGFLFPPSPLHRRRRVRHDSVVEVPTSGDIPPPPASPAPTATRRPQPKQWRGWAPSRLRNEYPYLSRTTTPSKTTANHPAGRCRATTLTGWRRSTRRRRHRWAAVPRGSPQREERSNPWICYRPSPRWLPPRGSSSPRGRRQNQRRTVGCPSRRPGALQLLGAAPGRPRIARAFPKYRRPRRQCRHRSPPVPIGKAQCEARLSVEWGWRRAHRTNAGHSVVASGAMACATVWWRHQGGL